MKLARTPAPALPAFCVLLLAGLASLSGPAPSFVHGQDTDSDTDGGESELPVVETTEPDNDHREDPLTVVDFAAPGVEVRGTLTKDDDELDQFLLRVSEEVVVDIRVTTGSHRLYVRGRSLDVSAYPDPGPGWQWRHVRLPVGDHEIHVRISRGVDDGPPDWSMSFRAVAPMPDPRVADIEPNGDKKAAQPFDTGVPRRGRGSRPDKTDHDFYTFEVPRRGVYRLRVRAPDAAEPMRPLSAQLTHSEHVREKYDYECNTGHETHVFFPVLDPGAWFLRISVARERFDEVYEVTLERFDPVLDDALMTRARAAIERGVQWLATTAVAEAADDERHPDATESLVAAALATGDGAGDRVESVTAYLDWIEGEFEEHEKGSWRGAPVYATDYDTYENAIVALGLAEIAGDGPPAVRERAKELCTRLVHWLLGAQQGPDKGQGWGGPVSPDDQQYGGWRYHGDSRDGDISVQGWVLIALLAADAAGISGPGMRDAVTRGMEFVGRCTGKHGFTYEPGRGAANDIRNSIGALLKTLWAGRPEGDAALRLSLEWLDERLPAGTQVDNGDDYVLYYGYYGTRLNYLRGGYPWLAWRCAMMRQLVRLQADDGSFPGSYKERTQVGPRFHTALAVMILRICLEEVPGYLRHEVRGF